jgi:hypothetical protein
MVPARPFKMTEQAGRDTPSWHRNVNDYCTVSCWPRSHAPRGNARPDALRHARRASRGATATLAAEQPHVRSHAERGNEEIAAPAGHHALDERLHVGKLVAGVRVRPDPEPLTDSVFEPTVAGGIGGPPCAVNAPAGSPSSLRGRCPCACPLAFLCASASLLFNRLAELAYPRVPFGDVIHVSCFRATNHRRLTKQTHPRLQA